MSVKLSPNKTSLQPPRKQTFIHIKYFRYRWEKNGKPFNWQVYSNRMLEQPGRGTLVITSPRTEDIGEWQDFTSWQSSHITEVFPLSRHLLFWRLKSRDGPKTSQVCQTSTLWRRFLSKHFSSKVKDFYLKGGNLFDWRELEGRVWWLEHSESYNFS